MATKVTAAMEKVFKRVKTPDASKRVATKFSKIPSSGPEPGLWNAGNANRRPRVYYHEESFGMFMDIRAKCLAAAATLPPEPVEAPEGGEDGEGGAEGEPAAEGDGAEGDSGEGEAGDAEGDTEPAPEELPFDGWDGSVSQVEESIAKLEEAIRRKADLDAAKETEGGGEDAEDADAPAEGEEAPEGGDEPPPVDEADAGPPPEDVLDAARAEFAEAMRVASLPQSRADLLAAALSEAVSNRLANVDETYETARAKYRPATPPPPPPKLDEDGNPIEEENPPAEDEPAPAEKDPDAKDSPWKRKCRKVLVRSIGEMLGLAAEAFERDAVAEAEAEVNTELIRRVRDMRVTAAKLETLGEEEDGENADENAEDDAMQNEQDDTMTQSDAPKPMSPGRAEWTEYELLRRRKALLGREVDPPAPRSRSRASTPVSRARTPA
jgi:hypothetical protein